MPDKNQGRYGYTEESVGVAMSEKTACDENHKCNNPFPLCGYENWSALTGACVYLATQNDFFCTNEAAWPENQDADDE